jgi:hypothetical protein
VQAEREITSAVEPDSHQRVLVAHFVTSLPTLTSGRGSFWRKGATRGEVLAPFARTQAWSVVPE